jgi:hypothetical protein
MVGALKSIRWKLRDRVIAGRAPDIPMEPLFVPRVIPAWDVAGLQQSDREHGPM